MYTTTKPPVDPSLPIVARATVRGCKAKIWVLFKRMDLLNMKKRGIGKSMVSLHCELDNRIWFSNLIKFTNARTKDFLRMRFQ